MAVGAEWWWVVVGGGGCVVAMICDEGWGGRRGFGGKTIRSRLGDRSAVVLLLCPPPLHVRSATSSCPSSFPTSLLLTIFSAHLTIYHVWKDTATSPSSASSITSHVHLLLLSTTESSLQKKDNHQHAPLSSIRSRAYNQQ